MGRGPACSRLWGWRRKAVSGRADLPNQAAPMCRCTCSGLGRTTRRPVRGGGGGGGHASRVAEGWGRIYSPGTLPRIDGGRRGGGGGWPLRLGSGMRGFVLLVALEWTSNAVNSYTKASRNKARYRIMDMVIKKWTGVLKILHIQHAIVKVNVFGGRCSNSLIVCSAPLFMPRA